MWQIQTGNTPSGQCTLTCISISRYLPSYDRPKIVKLEIWKHKNSVVTFKIHASNHKVSDSLYAKLHSIHSKRSGISKPTKDNTGRMLCPFLKVRVKYEKDLLGLNDVIKVLNNEINDFKLIRDSLPGILQITKQMISDNHSHNLNEHIEQFERYVENTMTSTTHASIRLSERELREKYNFPAPEFSVTDVTDDSSEHTLPLDSNTNIEHQHDYDSEEEDEEIESDIDEDTCYIGSECSIISNLAEQLNDLQDKYIETQFIEIDPRRTDIEYMKLTRRSINLLSQTDKSHINLDDVDSAKNALNVIAALRAISYRGSHYKNSGMRHTGISGYGMRNLVALMWHCCLNAERSNNLPSGVTLNDALLALARGIADGARGENRNRDSFDDLKNDYQTCDQGKYNCLFSAMLGILPEIKIDFDYTEALLQHLKSEIVNEIVAHTTDNAQAKELLKIWLGEQTDDASISYKELCEKIHNRFPQMIELFIDIKYPVDSTKLKNKIKAQINKEIKEMSQQSFGISYIESVSPTHEMLELAWKEAHPPKDENGSNIRKRMRLR